MGDHRDVTALPVRQRDFKLGDVLECVECGARSEPLRAIAGVAAEDGLWLTWLNGPHPRHDTPHEKVRCCWCQERLAGFPSVMGRPMPGQGPWVAGGPRLRFHIPPVEVSAARMADSSVDGASPAQPSMPGGEGKQDTSGSAGADAGVEVGQAGAAPVAPSGACPRDTAPAAGAEEPPLATDARQMRSHEPKRCSRCAAPIFWAQMLDGDDRRAFVRDQRSGRRRVKAIPVDCEPTAIGSVVLFHRAGEGIVCRVLRRGEEPPAGGKLRTFHRCSNLANRDARGFQPPHPARQISLAPGLADVEGAGSSQGGSR
jgi:hypothetical protein